MKNSLKISISKPCTENYESFESTELGGFCSSCKKEVIDFTQMTPTEFSNYFNNTNESVCGRFKSSQLNSSTNSNTTSSSFSLLSNGMVAAGFSLLALCTVTNLTAQETTSNKTPLKTEITSSTTDSLLTSPQETYTVSGTVLDETNLPLPGTSIVLKGTSEGVATDFDGKFEFPRALKEGDILVFNYLGYETKEYKVKASAESNIQLSIAFEASDIELMGEVVIGGVHTTKRSIFHRFISIFK